MTMNIIGVLVAHFFAQRAKKIEDPNSRRARICWVW